MQVSSAFVVIMGMGVTFVGLTCIIFLTMLMGKILSKPEAPKPAAAAAAPAAPAVPADGLTDEVKVARFNFEFHFFLYQRKGRHRAVLFATMKKIFDLAQN